MNEIKIHEAYRKVDGLLKVEGKHVPKFRVYRMMIEHSREKGHVYRKHHLFSDRCINEIVNKISQKI